MSDPVHMARIGMVFPHCQTKQTCVAVNDQSILVGTSNGSLYVYDRETEIDMYVHKDDGVGSDNAITAMDVHRWRTNYVILGYERGHLSLVDVKKKKTIKLTKDHHKGAAIVDVKFADWVRERPKTQTQIFMGFQPVLEEEVNAWMFISIDINGMVVVNEVTKVAAFFYADPRILVNPKKYTGPKFQTVATKFFQPTYMQSPLLDLSTVISLGSEESIVVFQITKDAMIEVTSVQRPMRYPSENFGTNSVPIYPRLPCMNWGYGNTPMCRDKPNCVLAFAFGPLVQLLVFRDLEQD